MEAFSLLKFWRNAAVDDLAGGRNSDTDTTLSSYETTIGYETDEEESFFDLEFTVPADSYHKEQNKVSESDEEDPRDDLVKKDRVTTSTFAESPSDVFFMGRDSPPEPNSKPQSPISFLRSPPKFPVFMLFKKSKLEKTENNDLSPATPKSNRQSKPFDGKCKVEEVPIFSLIARVNSSSSNLRNQSSEKVSSKRFPKDVVQKYLKLIKPLSFRSSKRYSDKMTFTNESATAAPSSSPASALVRSSRKQAEEKQRTRQAPLLVAYKHLGKSRSSSSTVGVISPPASRRDDSLMQQDDGIQGAILHCKRSYDSSRELCLLSRCTSDPCHEISVNATRNSTEEVMRRSSI